MIRLVIIASVALLLAAADDPEVITVPEDVLKFIIGCRQSASAGEYAVPIHQTSINDAAGTTSQHVSLLSLDELHHSLKQTVNNDAVLRHIISQVEDAARSDKIAMGRSDCHVENNITIDVPAQEIDDFNDRVQMLMQRNTFLLLEQINTLFSFKLRAQKTDTEKMIRRRTNQIMQKLDKIMAHLGIPIEEGGNDDDQGYEGEVTEDEFSTMMPGHEGVDVSTVFPEIEPKPEPVPDNPVDIQVQTELMPTGTQTVPQPEPEPDTGSGPELTTMAPSADPVTEAFPGGTSSEEDDDNDDDSNPAFNKTSQQQPPFVFNSGIALIPALARPANRARPSPRPVYRGSYLDRTRLAEQNRRRIYRRP